MSFLIWLVNSLVQLLVIVVIAYVLLSYVMAPYHPVRRTLAQFVDPMLAPIRRVVPLLGGIDISPVILILILEILGRIVVMLLLSLFT
ncbi:MAG: YggT family protein [Chloroflexota bacterium]